LSILILCLVALPTPARAQAVAIAQVTGTVTDATGSVVPNAQVTVTETEKQQVHSGTTDSSGRFTFPNLPVGPYSLEVKATGFKNYVQSGIVLQVGNSVEINVALQLGSMSEKVEVTATTRMVETRETGVAQVIDEKRINDLPLNGRQATQLILLSGASVQPPGATPW